MAVSLQSFEKRQVMTHVRGDNSDVGPVKAKSVQTRRAFQVGKLRHVMSLRQVAATQHNTLLDGCALTIK